MLGSIAVISALWVSGSASAVLDDAPSGPWRCRPDRPPQWAPEGLWSDPSLGTGEKLGRTLLHQSDLANGLLYFSAFAGIELGADPPNDARWQSSASFEDDVRDDLVSTSKTGRDRAALASDVLLGLTVSAPFWLDVGLGTYREGDCTAAVEMLGEAAEALFLTLALTEATKVIVGRERPYQRACAFDSDYDDDCGENDSRKSFFSGHASLTAAGAGVLCRNTYLREEPVWGYLGAVRNPLPCALGVGAAVATGMLRIAGDKHWLGDVLTGWAVGLTLGLLDLPGPFDLLRFRYRAADREITGAVVPNLGRGAAGARLVVRF